MFLNAKLSLRFDLLPLQGAGSLTSSGHRCGTLFHQSSTSPFPRGIRPLGLGREIRTRPGDQQGSDCCSLHVFIAYTYIYIMMYSTVQKSNSAPGFLKIFPSFYLDTGSHSFSLQSIFRGAFLFLC